MRRLRKPSVPDRFLVVGRMAFFTYLKSEKVINKDSDCCYQKNAQNKNNSYSVFLFSTIGFPIIIQRINAYHYDSNRQSKKQFFRNKSVC